MRILSILYTAVIITAMAINGNAFLPGKPLASQPSDSIVLPLGNGQYTYVLRSNRHVINMSGQEIPEFTDGYAVVSEQGFYGVIDSNGATLFAIKETPDISIFLTYAGEGMFAVIYGNRVGFLDHTGKVSVQVIYGGGGGATPTFSEGVCCVLDSTETYYAFIDKTGKPAFDFTIQGSLGGAATYYFPEFHDGLCVAHKNYKFGYIDHQGKWAIRPQFDRAARFGEGLAAVRIKGKVIFINTKGEQAISRSFGTIDEGCCGFLYGYFENGEATVNIDTSQLSIDPRDYDSNRDYSKDKSAVIDKSGKVIRYFEE